MTKSDWDYRGLATECYDLWFGSEPFWDQVFFRDRIRHNGGAALEIACGTGRLLAPFLRDGLAVEGLDASSEMLAICRSRRRRLEWPRRQWRTRRSGVRPSDGATILIHEATQSDRVEQVQHISMRHEVFKGGLLVQTQLRTHQLRWCHRHEFAMMLASVGFRGVTVQCGYTASDARNPEAEWIFMAER